MHQVKIQIEGVTYQMEVPTGANLLLEAASRGIPLPFRCTSGRCGTCQMKVVQGEEGLNLPTTQETVRLDKQVDIGYRLACQTYVQGDLLIEIVPMKETS
ncbi:2Fe-2S iron-sulfur cluster-binding protein [Hazenella coriacea]|uniref:Ferredoxin n=1 Tax=Hazenella coriacea TaxID=1179467 RepID=A0A4R3L4M0_9BACL|nr:2Fe-2S iron-sulfur cluster-binding protein [Hazenella coriacea]TCS94731.1 ferredoxin [Hazenella coriacea]